jgi:hypothetical protein
MPDQFEPIEVTVRGPARAPERRCVGGQPVIVHFDHLPEKDVTTEPCSGSLRPSRRSVVDVCKYSMVDAGLLALTGSPVRRSTARDEIILGAARLW